VLQQAETVTEQVSRVSALDSH